MASFEQWTREISERQNNNDIQSKLDIISEEMGLLDWFSHDDENNILYPCRRCGELTNVDLDMSELRNFDESMCYCGKSQYCIP